MIVRVANILEHQRSQINRERRSCLGHIKILFVALPVLLKLTLNFNQIIINMAAAAIKKFIPLFDRVLVERFAAETKTKGGLLLPEKAQGKVLDATVVAVGEGARNQTGEIIPPGVTVGDRVILPEYGGTKVVLDDKEYYLFRSSDILGKIKD